MREFAQAADFVILKLWIRFFLLSLLLLSAALHLERAFSLIHNAFCTATATQQTSRHQSTTRKHAKVWCKGKLF